MELFVEEGELSDEQEFTEQDLPTSEEQTYRETMRGIRSFMGWSYVPDIDSSNPSDDNPFTGPKTPAPSKVSVQMPTEEWLCKKLSKPNVTLVEHLTDFVFITIGNLTLTRCDAYLNHVKNGIKPDTLAALRMAPLHISTLFPDTAIKRAEEEIALYDNKGQSTSLSSCHKGRFHPYERPEKRVEGRSDAKQEIPAWKNIGKCQFRQSSGMNSNFSSRSAKGQQTYK